MVQSSLTLSQQITNQTHDNDVIEQLLTPLAYFFSTHDGGDIYVACSGGRDSLSLAYACRLLYENKRILQLPVLIHIHHGIQSANALWAQQVSAWAKIHGFIHHIIELNLGQVNETTARTARYKAFAHIMKDGDTLLTAHHRDDQAETLIMRLTHGTGIHGLVGIKSWQTKVIDDKSIHIHRPWLSISRAKITAFAHTHRLTYIDDPTNNTTDNARSLIRNVILPHLHAINPQASANIARTADQLGLSVAVFDDVIMQGLASCMVYQSHHDSALAIDRLMKLPSHQHGAILHRFAQGDVSSSPTSRITHELMALALRSHNDHNSRLVWQNYIFCRYGTWLYRYDKQVFELLNTKTAPTPTLSDDGYLLKNNDKLALRWQSPINSTLYPTPLTHHDKLPITLNLGNTVVLRGKKLAQTLKIPPWLRHNLWVIYDNDMPVALVSASHLWQLAHNNSTLIITVAKWCTIK